ncbi:MAG: DNA polymerase III subunit gamma/tau [Phycisphaera sp.]|nr:DNA polymerase III subunit gamma/tau [Phycisphaera sp.]
MAKRPATSPSGAKAAEGAGEAASDGAATRPYTVLARRYRSRDFGEVVGQEPIARTLQNAILTGRTAHAYLFCGTRGVGKTSMARIFARALNERRGLAEGEAIGEAILRGEDLDVIEIDGASNRGIDDARDLIAGATLAPTRGQYRIYIIDEVHMLTTPAFNALLKTMEEPPKHVKFILCTTEPHKVPQTIQSRCQRFDFRNIPTRQIAAHLGAVAAGEGIEVTEDVLLAVARLANGSMRDGLSLLDRLLAAATGRVDAAVLEQVFGLPDDEILLDIIEACVSERTADALRHGARLLERGSGVEQALELLAERFRWILVAAATTGQDAADDLLEVAQSMRERVQRIAAATDAAFAVHAIALCDATARNARGSSAPRALYDACIARISLAPRFSAGAALLAGGSSRGGDAKKAGDPGAPRALGLKSEAQPTRALEPQGRPQQSAAPTVEPKPAALEPKPAALEPKPAALEPKPAALEPKPAALEPKPAALEQRPAPPEPTASEATDLATLRARASAIAAQSAKDQALLSQIELRAFDAGVARIALPREGGAAYLATNPEPIRALLSRAAGRPIRIDIERSEAESRSAPRPATVSATDEQAARADPLVRRAIDLFDATIVSVTPRVAADAPSDG